jgi:hypothetical protein
MGRDKIWFVSLIVLVVLVTVAIYTSYPSLQQFGMKRNTFESQEPLSPRPMPVVENYFSTGWDFRARSLEEQVLVVTRDFETWDVKLFRIGAAVNLCAHLGYHPPTILVEQGRKDDIPAPSIYRDIPTRIQDIFPKLRVLSVDHIDKFLSSHLSNSMLVKGCTDFGGHNPQVESFPEITSSTIIIDGHWESWECVDDYKTALFDQLEFHPVIYHHCRKTYPEFFDRRVFVKSVFCSNIDPLVASNIKNIITKNTTENQKVYIFTDHTVEEKLLTKWFGKGYNDKITIVVGECSQILMYLGVFCRELLIDLSPASWWIGFHATYRGRAVYYIPTDRVKEECVYPEWLPNKKYIKDERV